MFIKDNKKQFYELVLRSARRSSRVLVLVGHDVDAICGTRIIQHLFECDHVQYTMIPIKTADELVRAYREHSPLVRDVLLINIGISFDVVELLEPRPDVRIFIADSHRPVDVYNVYRDKQVCILTTTLDSDDTDDELAAIPKYEDLFRDDDDDEDMGEEDTDVRRLSLEQLERRRERQKWERNRKRVLFEYTQFSYHSHSTALTLFDLSWKLSKDNNEQLWLAMVGVADQFANGKIGRRAYDRQRRYLKDAMTRLRNIRGHGMALNAIAHNNETNANSLAFNNHLILTYEKDLQLNLYRQWSVYESLRHTMYVSCKFRIWKLRGHKRLLAFLAELGLPLVQCRQKFTAMDADFRNNVKEWIENLSEKYGLTQIIDHSFVANRGFKHKYTAADVSLAARALLESCDKTKRHNQKFFDAIDSLSWSNLDVLETGLGLARVQLVAILKQVQTIVDTRRVALMNGHFWYVCIDETTPDANLFCHPLCLSSLARHVLHAHASSNPKSQKSFQLPLVLVTPDPYETGMALAIGIPPLAVSEPRNFFSKAFVQISQRLTDCQIEPNLVDFCVVQLSYAHRMTFLNELSALLS